MPKIAASSAAGESADPSTAAVKISGSSRGRREVCRFDDPGDHHHGDLTALPRWESDPYTEGRRMWVFHLDHLGRRYELRARRQMAQAIREAVAYTGGDLEIGGHLTVTFCGYASDGKTKRYDACYEEPERCACGDPRLHGTPAMPTLFDAIDRMGE